MAHFYAIAIYRLDDYRRANLPVWPVSKGVPNTIKWIFFYMVFFMFANIGLSLFANAGFIYLMIMLVISYLWMYLSVKKVSKIDDGLWAKQVFKHSLWVNIGFLVSLVLVRI